MILGFFLYDLVLLLMLFGLLLNSFFLMNLWRKQKKILDFQRTILTCVALKEPEKKQITHKKGGWPKGKPRKIHKENNNEPTGP